MSVSYASIVRIVVTLVSGWFMTIGSGGNLAHGQGRTEKIAMTGESIGFQSLQYRVFNDVTIAGNGDVAFLHNTTQFNPIGRGISIGDGVTNSLLVQSGQSLPPVNFTFSAVSGLSFDANGDIGFAANSTSSTGQLNGLFVGNQTQMNNVAALGAVAPGGTESFLGFQPLRRNRAGVGVFDAVLDNNSLGVYKIDNSGITEVARQGYTVPGTSKTFISVGLGNLSDNGTIAFQARTSEGWDELYRFDSSGLTPIAANGQSISDGDGQILSATGTNVNDSGTVVFRAALSDTMLTRNTGLFLSDGTTVTTVAREGNAAPGGGDFTDQAFGAPEVSNAGQVVFTGFSTDFDRRIYRSGVNGLSVIVANNQAAPDGNGQFNQPDDRYQLNSGGQVVAISNLKNTSGGNADNLAMVIGDGVELLQVARKGDSLQGSTISWLRNDNLLGGVDASGIRMLNNFGQVAYVAELADGRQVLNRWTPDLNLRSNNSIALWDDPNNWTLSLDPALVHDVYFNPTGDQTLTGSNIDRTVKSFSFGTDTGLATLELQQGTVLTAIDQISIGVNGRITGHGQLQGNLVQAGVISPGNTPGTMSITGSLEMLSTARTEIELAGLDPLEFDHLLVSGDATLAGQLEVSLIQGHTLGSFEEYLFAEIGGARLGQFDNLISGSRVGVFGGVDLFIRYDAGDGNDISLYTLNAIPEPSSLAFLVLATVGGLCVRTRRRCALLDSGYCVRLDAGCHAMRNPGYREKFLENKKIANVFAYGSSRS